MRAPLVTQIHFPLSTSIMLLRIVKFLLSIFLVLRQVEGACDLSTQILNDLTFQLSGSQLEWPCQSTKNIYVQSGRFVPKNVIATRAQIFRDEAFVTLPRLKSGVPFTLGKVSMKKGQCVTSIVPFPCWSLQEEGNCDALQSVVDIFLDGNDLLWALDTGIVNTMEQPVRRCGPKVVAINVKTGKVVKSINLSSLVVSHSRLQHLVVEYDEGGNAYV